MEWINVEDKLPDSETGVLAYQKTPSGLWIIVVACIDKNGKWVTVDFWTDDVIHEIEPSYWMPLPEPPRI